MIRFWALVSNMSGRSWVSTIPTPRLCAGLSERRNERLVLTAACLWCDWIVDISLKGIFGQLPTQLTRASKYKQKVTCRTRLRGRQLDAVCEGLKGFEAADGFELSPPGCAVSDNARAICGKNLSYKSGQMGASVRSRVLSRKRFTCQIGKRSGAFFGVLQG